MQTLNRSAAEIAGRLADASAGPERRGAPARTGVIIGRREMYREKKNTCLQRHINKATANVRRVPHGRRHRGPIQGQRGDRCAPADSARPSPSSLDSARPSPSSSDSARRPVSIGETSDDGAWRGKRPGGGRRRMEGKTTRPSLFGRSADGRVRPIDARRLAGRLARAHDSGFLHVNVRKTPKENSTTSRDALLGVVGTVSCPSQDETARDRWSTRTSGRASAARALVRPLPNARRRVRSNSDVRPSRNTKGEKSP